MMLLLPFTPYSVCMQSQILSSLGNLIKNICTAPYTKCGTGAMVSLADWWYQQLSACLQHLEVLFLSPPCQIELVCVYNDLNQS